MVRLNTNYVGIDPGTSGGIAVIGPRGVRTWPAPKTEQETWVIINGLAEEVSGIPSLAVIERVTAYIKGGEGQSRPSMFTFGGSYFALRAFLVAAGIDFQVVQPNVWQRRLDIPPRIKGRAVTLENGRRSYSVGETKSEWKNRLRDHAAKLYPGVRLTLKTADALLIAHYCYITAMLSERERRE